MIVSSVKIDEIFYVLNDDGKVYEQYPSDSMFYPYRVRSSVCKGLLRKTINALSAQTKLHKDEMSELKHQIELLQISLKKKSREVRCLKTALCNKCLEKGKNIREAL